MTNRLIKITAIIIAISMVFTLCVYLYNAEEIVSFNYFNKVTEYFYKSSNK